jgi:hypothetical protein
VQTSRDTPGNAQKPNSQQKIAMTDDAARKIIAAEATAREKKTEKLRQLRLKAELENPVVAAPAKKKR